MHRMRISLARRIQQNHAHTQNNAHAENVRKIKLTVNRIVYDGTHSNDLFAIKSCN